MLKHLNYLTWSIFKKKVPFIFVAVGMFVNLAITIAIIKSANGDHRSHLRIVDNFDNFTSFIFGVIFAIIVTLHAFKDDQRNGMELLIATKKIRRSRIVASKFAFVIIAIFAYQLIALLFNGISAGVDSYATTSAKLRYVLSLFVGGFIIQIFFAIFMILLVTFLSRNLSVLIGMIVAVILPVISFFVTPALQGNPKDLQEINTPYFTLNSKVKNEQEFHELTEDVHYYDVYNTTLSRDYANYRKSETYHNYAYIDLWYQFNNVFGMFIDKDRYSDTVVQRWNSVKTQVVDNGNAIYAGNDGYGKDEYIVLAAAGHDWTFDNFNSKPFTFKDNVVESGASLHAFLQQNPDIAAKFEKGTISQRLQTIQFFVRGQKRIDSTSSNAIRELYVSENQNDMLGSLLKVEPISALAYQYYLSMHPNLPAPTHTFDFENQEQAMVGNFMIVGKEIVNYVPTDFLNYGGIISFWIIATILMGVAAGWSNLRKDFK